MINISSMQKNASLFVMLLSILYPHPLCGAASSTIAIDESQATSDERLNRDLIRAVRKGNIMRAKELLVAGANPDAQNAHNQTPLFFAARNCCPEAVQLLLEHKASVDSIESIMGRTALHEVLFSPRLPQKASDVIRLLIDAGADVHKKGVLVEWTPLHIVAQNKKLPDDKAAHIIHMLIEAGARLQEYDTFNQAPHMVACNTFRRSLLANLNYPNSQPDNDSLTVALFEAIHRRQTALVRRLLLAGANPNARKKGRLNPAPLYFAIMGRCYPIVKLLLKHQADVNYAYTVESHVISPIIAVFENTKYGKPNILRALIKHKANVQVRDTLGRTPLHIAAAINIPEKNALHIISLLVHAGADTGATTRGRTPAEYALAHNKVYRAKLIGSYISSRDVRPVIASSAPASSSGL